MTIQVDSPIASTAEGSGSTMVSAPVGSGTGGGVRSLEWRNIRYVLHAAKEGEESKTILDGPSGKLAVGEMLAILGPSGSGKSSLLNALAGRVPLAGKEATLSGEVLVNGTPMAAGLAKHAAYVEQDEALFALASVEETLGFAADLRLPRDTPIAAKRERVDAVIAELGLVNARHTLVGGIQAGQPRGLSGGERKRLNIAIDLIHQPNVIILDEPTSGLDSFQALNVMNGLLSLTAHGRMVICSVHQPRSSIYSALDKVLFLTQGKQVFMGTTAGATAFFERAGHPLPPAYNPADWYLDAISVDYKTEDATNKTMGKVKAILDLAEADEREAAAEAAPVKADAGALSAPADADEAPVVPVGAGFLATYLLLLKRTWREQTRNPVALGIKLGMNIFFAIIFGLVYLRMPRDQDSIQNRTGIIFFSAMNASFGAPIGVSQAIPKELRVVRRERAANMYGVLPYYLAVFTASLPLELIPGIFFSTVLYFMANLRPGGQFFLIYTGVQMLHYFVGCALGMVISASITDVALAPQIAPAITVLFLLFAGYLINDDSIPQWLMWLKYACTYDLPPRRSWQLDAAALGNVAANENTLELTMFSPQSSAFIRYTFHALIINEFNDSSFSCDALPPPPPATADAGGAGGVVLDGEPGAPGCLQGDDWLRFLSFEGETVLENVLALVGLLVGFHTLAFTILVARRPKFQLIQPPGGDAKKLA